MKANLTKLSGHLSYYLYFELLIDIHDINTENYTNILVRIIKINFWIIDIIRTLNN